MSFVRNQIEMAGGNVKQPVHQFKHCAKCDTKRAPEGGIEMSPTKWICASCWTLRATRLPRKSK